MGRIRTHTFLAIVLILLAAGILLLSEGGILQPAQDFILRPISSIQSWIAVRYSAIRDLINSPSDLAEYRARTAELELEVAQLQQEIIALAPLIPLYISNHRSVYNVYCKNTARNAFGKFYFYLWTNDLPPSYFDPLYSWIFIQKILPVVLISLFTLIFIITGVLVNHYKNKTHNPPKSVKP